VQVQERDVLVASAAYQPEPAAAAAARRFVRDTLRSWPLAGRPARRDTLIDDAVLLTSELVTNAVVHAGTSVHVTCKLAGGAVEIAVQDGRPAELIPDRPPPADVAERTSGRGLQLPAQLASAWGVTYARAAKAVWFRICLPGPEAWAGTDGRSDGDAVPGNGPGIPAGNPPGSRPTDWPGPRPTDWPGPRPTDWPGPRPTDWPGPAAGDRLGRTGLLALTPVMAANVQASARRSLSKLGYEELLGSTAEAGRAAAAADFGYLLDAGEDGDLRVRAAAGAGHPQRAAGSVTWSAVRALDGAVLSLVTVPLVVNGRVTGVLAVAAAEPDRFTERDAARLQELADSAAPAIERARLAELETGRQVRAEYLSAASEELAASLDEKRIAATGVRLAVGQLASWCAVLVPDGNGALRPLHAGHADAARLEGLEWLLDHAEPAAGHHGDPPARNRRAGWRWTLEPSRDRSCGPRGQSAAASGDRMPPGAAELAADQAWCFPLDTGDRTLGLLAIGGRPGGHWAAREARELAAGLARRIAIAMDNAALAALRQVSAAAPDQEPARR
jgi:anti-sigma regulatory factor (Ser/Thr protein kinase)